MTKNNFKTTLENLLKTDERLIDEEKELNLSIIKELSNKTDEKLIELLISNTETKKKFFLQLKNTLVFKQTDFKFFLDENKIDNSYTAYENKIGLSSNNRLLKDSGDVVLNFPYKDCVLEGGQSTEEGMDEYFEFDETAATYNLHKAQRKEIFFNEVIAKDEIDRLEEPKAFTNIKKYTANGEEELKEFTRDANGTITDNLIIKGNNLLALHSLKEEFTGKIKLIYIDPPYYFNESKATDSFAYNSNFKLSTWLAFMKNRLENAKELLQNDGTIFVQIDDDGQAYLKVLMDEVFEGNYLNTIIVKAKATSGASGGGEDKKIKKNTEYIHIYKKSNGFKKFNDQFIRVSLLSYISELKEDEKSFSYTQILIDEGKKEYFTSTVDGRNLEIKIYKHFNYKIKTISQISKEEKISEIAVYEKYIDKIFTTENAQTSIRDRVLDATDNENTFYTIEYIPISGKNKGAITNVSFIGTTKRLVSYLKNSCEFEGKKIYKLLKLGTLWDDMSWSSVFIEGGVKLKNGKKPENLLQRIIEMTTNEKEIILDYHLGSGTTAAVAHKLNRQYIGLEQLDYGEHDSVVRLKNVVDGDSTGISKSVKWQGGGSFVYLELAKCNEEAKEKIVACKSLKELEKLLNELSEKYFLHYNVKFAAFKDKIIKEENFKKLPLQKQQEMFCKMLDLNQLYVNTSEMEDKKFGLSKEDIALTKNFYNL